MSPKPFSIDISRLSHAKMVEAGYDQSSISITGGLVDPPVMTITFPEYGHLRCVITCDKAMTFESWNLPTTLMGDPVLVSLTTNPNEFQLDLNLGLYDSQYYQFNPVVKIGDYIITCSEVNFQGTGGTFVCSVMHTIYDDTTGEHHLDVYTNRYGNSGCFIRSKIDGITVPSLTRELTNDYTTLSFFEESYALGLHDLTIEVESFGVIKYYSFKFVGALQSVLTTLDTFSINYNGLGEWIINTNRKNKANILFYVDDILVDTLENQYILSWPHTYIFSRAAYEPGTHSTYIEILDPSKSESVVSQTETFEGTKPQSIPVGYNQTLDWIFTSQFSPTESSKHAALFDFEGAAGDEIIINTWDHGADQLEYIKVLDSNFNLVDSAQIGWGNVTYNVTLPSTGLYYIEAGCYYVGEQCNVQLNFNSSTNAGQPTVSNDTITTLTIPNTTGNIIVPVTVYATSVADPLSIIYASRATAKAYEFWKGTLQSGTIRSIDDNNDGSFVINFDYTGLIVGQPGDSIGINPYYYIVDANGVRSRVVTLDINIVISAPLTVNVTPVEDSSTYTLYVTTSRPDSVVLDYYVNGNFDSEVGPGLVDWPQVYVIDKNRYVGDCTVYVDVYDNNTGDEIVSDTYSFTGGMMAIPITYGQTQNFTLDAYSYRSINRGPNYYMGLFTFDAVAGDVITITELALSGFTHCYLYLMDDTFSPLRSDYNSAGSYNARINSYTIPWTGKFYIDATTYFTNAMGTISVQLQAASALPSPVLSNTAPVSAVTLAQGVSMYELTVTLSATHPNGAVIPISTLYEITPFDQNQVIFSRVDNYNGTYTIKYRFSNITTTTTFPGATYRITDQSLKVSNTLTLPSLTVTVPVGVTATNVNLNYNTTTLNMVPNASLNAYYNLLIGMPYNGGQRYWVIIQPTDQSLTLNRSGVFDDSAWYDGSIGNATYHTGISIPSGLKSLVYTGSPNRNFVLSVAPGSNGLPNPLPVYFGIYDALENIPANYTDFAYYWNNGGGVNAYYTSNPNLWENNNIVAKDKNGLVLGTTSLDTTTSYAIGNDYGTYLRQAIGNNVYMNGNQLLNCDLTGWFFITTTHPYGGGSVTMKYRDIATENAFHYYPQQYVSEMLADMPINGVGVHKRNFEADYYTLNTSTSILAGDLTYNPAANSNDDSGIKNAYYGYWNDKPVCNAGYNIMALNSVGESSWSWATQPVYVLDMTGYTANTQLSIREWEDGGQPESQFAFKFLATKAGRVVLIKRNRALAHFGATYIEPQYQNRFIVVDFGTDYLIHSIKTKLWPDGLAWQMQIQAEKGCTYQLSNGTINAPAGVSIGTTETGVEAVTWIHDSGNTTGFMNPATPTIYTLTVTRTSDSKVETRQILLHHLTGLNDFNGQTFPQFYEKDITLHINAVYTAGTHSTVYTITATGADAGLINWNSSKFSIYETFGTNVTRMSFMGNGSSAVLTQDAKALPVDYYNDIISTIDATGTSGIHHLFIDLNATKMIDTNGKCMAPVRAKNTASTYTMP